MAHTRGHHTVVGVGGVIRTEGGVLLVRLTYSRYRGQFMFPGGKLEPGESLEAGLVREVQEETGVRAEPRGIVAVRHRVDPNETNTYVMFLMDHQSGVPRPGSPECDAVQAFGLEDFRCAPDKFVGLVPAVARPVLEGQHILLPPVDYVPVDSDHTTETFRIHGATG